MIVRLDREALVQSQNQKDLGVESDSGPKVVSEVDKIVEETKQKIADGSTPAVGVSPSNGGRGHDSVTAEGNEFVPTSLDGAVVEEEPANISDEDSPGGSPKSETAAPDTKTAETKAGKDDTAVDATKKPTS